MNKKLIVGMSLIFIIFFTLSHHTSNFNNEFGVDSKTTLGKNIDNFKNDLHPSDYSSNLCQTIQSLNF